MATKTNYLLQLTDQLRNAGTSELRVSALNKFLEVYQNLPMYKATSDATYEVSAGTLEPGSLYRNVGVKPAVIEIAKKPKKVARPKDPIKKA